jgi:hypothetical protein
VKRLNNAQRKDHSFGGCTGHPYTAKLSPMTTNALGRGSSACASLWMNTLDVTDAQRASCPTG